MILPVALLVLATPPPPILFHNVAISADGKLALTGNGYDAARLIDLATGEAACYDGTQPHWVRPRVPIVGNGEAPLVLQIFVP